MARHTILGTWVILITSLVAEPCSATTIELDWHQRYENKEFSIEAEFDTLIKGKLHGQDLVVDADTLIANGVAVQEAVVNVLDHEELSIGVNIFRCREDCSWSINFTSVEVATSSRVNEICRNNPKSIEGKFERYFFCRDAYQKYFSAGYPCWTEAMAALTGWFEAAYKLNEQTRRNGVAFIARDREAEAYVNDGLLACRDFESKVRRKNGYFRSMMRNLDIAGLERTQQVERSLRAQQEDAARTLASQIVKSLERAEPLRATLPPKDVGYVENVLNKALGQNPPFILH